MLLFCRYNVILDFPPTIEIKRLFRGGPLHYKKCALELCFSSCVYKNVAIGYYLSCVLHKCNSTTGHIAAFTKCDYRPALKLHFVMLRLRLAR